MFIHFIYPQNPAVQLPEKKNTFLFFPGTEGGFLKTFHQIPCWTQPKITIFSEPHLRDGLHHLEAVGTGRNPCVMFSTLGYLVMLYGKISCASFPAFPNASLLASKMHVLLTVSLATPTPVSLGPPCYWGLPQLTALDTVEHLSMLAKSPSHHPSCH